jgi:hypothetical protein
MQIYLNPDNDAGWAEKESADYEEAQEAVATGRALLRQVGLVHKLVAVQHKKGFGTEF